MSKKIDKGLILSSIKKLYGFKSDTEFAKFLGIKPQTLSSWYSRNTFDVDLLLKVNSEFLLSGIGPIFKKEEEVSSLNEPIEIYRHRDRDKDLLISTQTKLIEQLEHRIYKLSKKLDSKKKQSNSIQNNVD